jgi:hypothetical protein
MKANGLQLTQSAGGLPVSDLSSYRHRCQRMAHGCVWKSKSARSRTQLKDDANRIRRRNVSLSRDGLDDFPTVTGNADLGDVTLSDSISQTD